MTLSLPATNPIDNQILRSKHQNQISLAILLHSGDLVPPILLMYALAVALSVNILTCLFFT